MVRSLIEQLGARRPTAEGAPDPRTIPQRHADALIELCDRGPRRRGFPTTGGEVSHLTVTIDWDALRTALGTATLDYGQLNQRRRFPPAGLRLQAASSFDEFGDPAALRLRAPAIQQGVGGRGVQVTGEHRAQGLLELVGLP